MSNVDLTKLTGLQQVRLQSSLWNALDKTTNFLRSKPKGDQVADSDMDSDEDQRIVADVKLQKFLEKSRSAMNEQRL